MAARKKSSTDVRSLSSCGHVNNRYLDLNVKLPRVYGFAEDAVKSLVKANVNRGKLDMFITVNVTEDTSVKIALNKPVLEGYLAALKSIACRLRRARRHFRHCPVPHARRLCD